MRSSLILAIVAGVLFLAAAALTVTAGVKRSGGVERSGTTSEVPGEEGPPGNQGPPGPLNAYYLTSPVTFTPAPGQITSFTPDLFRSNAHTVVFSGEIVLTNAFTSGILALGTVDSPLQTIDKIVWAVPQAPEIPATSVRVFSGTVMLQKPYSAPVYPAGTVLRFGATVPL